MANAIYPGTFDPVTLGHMDVIVTASKIFDNIFVAILVNPAKKPRFTLLERSEMIKLALREHGITNANVIASEDLAVKTAERFGAEFMIRGLRLNTDFEGELFLHFNNQILDNEVKTVWMPPEQGHLHISSTAVRTILDYKDYPTLEKYLPKSVKDYIANREEE